MTDQGRGTGENTGAGNPVAYALIAFLILLGVVSQCDGKSSAPAPPEASESSDGGEACPLVPMEPVKVETISAAYEANEASAQKAYGDRCLLILGTVEEIDLDMSDDPVIRLAGQGTIRPTVRLLDQASDQATLLAKGEKTHFLCGDVSEFLGTPTFDECFVVDPKANAAP